MDVTSRDPWNLGWGVFRLGGEPMFFKGDRQPYGIVLKKGRICVAVEMYP